jgi:endonuclease/exonuclease/phosphatase family metal-dependent hydrolase
MMIAAALAAASTLSAQRRANTLAPSGASFRLLEWNVSDSEWVKHADETRAVLRHADADVFVLAQVAGSIDALAIRRMLAGLRGPSDTTWFVSVRAGEPVEHTVIASRDTIREVPEFETVLYPETGRGAVLAQPDTAQGTPARDRIASVHTNGALVRANGSWIFVVGVHLTCCGVANSWREYRRQLGAAVIRDRTRAVLVREHPSSMIVAGDMNLVSGSAALDTLLSIASQPPVGPMRRAEAIHADGLTDWTWDGRGTAFTNARLDNVIYSSGTLAVLRARVWDTELLPPDTLGAHHLTVATSRTINRHRPVVVDFEVGR